METSQIAQVDRPNNNFPSSTQTPSQRSCNLDKYTQLDRSFFVSLTLSNLEGAEAQVRAACDGVHLVELRVDLLDKQESKQRFHDFVARQVALLRQYTDLDIIYTVRTKSQAGTWPDDDLDGLVELYELGLGLGIEILDVEMHLDSATIQSITKKARLQQILLLMSHHDPQGRLSWSDGSWMEWYERGRQYGDMVKLVGMAKEFNDNLSLEMFRRKTSAISNIPLIAINMGSIGQTSRILNDFMTPVTHAALAKAAPGQLSAVEIRRAMVLMGFSGANEASSASLGATSPPSQRTMKL